MNFHSQFTAEIARHLSPKLRPRYAALTTERMVLGEPDAVTVSTETRCPDVDVHVQTRAGVLTPEAVKARGPVQLRTVPPEKIPHVSVEIVDAEGRELVTAIEVLSPTNKSGRGRKQYLRRREQLLLSGVNLIEVDLISEGRRIPFTKPLPTGRYYVFLTRADDQPPTDVWPLTLQDILPTIPVPLLDDDPDVLLDLQETFHSMYDAVGYDMPVDYRKDVRVPMTGLEVSFIDSTLRAAGIRR